MNNDIRITIEKYLDGDMTIEERQAFETLLKTDTSVQDEWQNQLMAKKIIDLQIENSLRSKMQTWSTSAKPKPFLGIQWIRAAAVAASLFFVIASGHFYASYNFSDQALYEDSVTLLTESTRGSDTQDGINAVYETIKLLETNPAEAKAKLQELYQLETLLETKHLIEWNLIRAELKLNNADKAKLLLSKIIENPQHPYQKKAGKLNDKLNSFWRKLQ